MEIDLAEKMNVSRTPIREAIRELAEDGLVTIEPRHGAYVSNISTKDMLDVFEVREDLEGLAAYLAASRVTEEQKIELGKLARYYELAIEKGDKSEIVEFDENFHNYIVKCSANKTLAQMVNQVQELSLRFRYIYYDDPDTYASMIGDHRRIMEAVVSGDPDKAREEADRHVKDLKKFIVDLDKRLSEEDS